MFFPMCSVKSNEREIEIEREREREFLRFSVSNFYEPKDTKTTQSIGIEILRFSYNQMGPKRWMHLWLSIMSFYLLFVIGRAHG
jgi:hypothetical protein